MSEMFLKRQVHVHEDVGLTKLHECYRFVDPENGQDLGVAVEEATFATRLQKLFLDKAFIPVTIRLDDRNGETLMVLKHPRCLLRSTAVAYHGDGRVLAVFNQIMCCLSSKLEILDGQNQPMGTLEGGWRNRRFSLRDSSGVEVGRIEHLFGGVTREFFTTADDYKIEVLGDLSWNPYLLASVLVIDILYHEN